MKIYGDETDDFDSHINIESLQYIIADMQRDLLSRDNQITILTAKLTEQEAELVKLRKVAEAAAAIRDLEQRIATLKADLAALREVEREKVAAWILSFGFATGHGDTIEDLLSEAGTQIQELRAAQEWVPVLGYRMTPADVARFWVKVDATEYCWEWTGSKGADGYGRFRAVAGESTQGAHRVAYALIHGDFDQDRHVCHKCDNPGCVNPNHLFLGDHAGNMLDKHAKGRCIIGSQKSSRFTGVSWRHDVNRWRVSFKHKGVTKHLGSYLSEEDAARAYDKAASAVFGHDWPHLNFPLPPQPAQENAEDGV